MKTAPPVSIHSEAYRRQPEACRYICGLISSFVFLHTPIPERWDIDEFMLSLGTASSGERMAMLFVANVWNPGYARENEWLFDVFDALARWDSRGRAAFSAWVQNPRMP